MFYLRFNTSLTSKMSEILPIIPIAPLYYIKYFFHFLPFYDLSIEDFLSASFKSAAEVRRRKLRVFIGTKR